MLKNVSKLKDIHIKHISTKVYYFFFEMLSDNWDFISFRIKEVYP